MNRYVTFLSLSLCIHFSAHTQRVTLIEVLPELNSQTASFWNQATMQHDIIGSDFRGKKEIGNASAERFEGLGPAPDFWFPIGIHKKTIGGELTDMYIFDLGDDHDHNLNIIPTLDFNNDFKYSIQVATNRMEGNDPLVDAAFESKSGCKKEDFENFLVKEMQLEIDLHNSNAKSYFSKGKPHAPRVRQGSKRGDIVFAYGPWVSDAGHCFKPEIHPAEQIWWKKDILTSLI